MTSYSLTQELAEHRERARIEREERATRLREQEIANARRARAVEILLTIPWSRLQSEYRLRGAKPGNAGFRPDDVVYTPESEWQAIRGER